MFGAPLLLTRVELSKHTGSSRWDAANRAFGAVARVTWSITCPATGPRWRVRERGGAVDDLTGQESCPRLGGG